MKADGTWEHRYLRGTRPAVAEAGTCSEAAYFGTVRVVLMADRVWSNLLLVLTVIGLWKMRPLGMGRDDDGELDLVLLDDGDNRAGRCDDAGSRHALVLPPHPLRRPA